MSTKSEFVPLLELAELSGLRPRTLYNQRHRGGHLASILTKFGGRVGCWRADWEKYKASQLRLPQQESGDLDVTSVQAASINAKSKTQRRNHGKRSAAE